MATLSVFFLSAYLLLSLFPSAAFGDSVASPILAGSIGKDCVEGAVHSGHALGKNISIADVPTYFAEPASEPAVKKVILFLSDVYSPFYINNQLLQDEFASNGFYVLGIDYFFGDPIQDNQGRPGFNQTAWFNKSRKQAEESLPKWLAAVRQIYGADAKYGAVGYCFGAPYALELGATENVIASAFAHPSGLTEDHFNKLKKPLLLSCAETDSSFPTASLRRASDILAQRKATYHLQIFSGTTHGFATRADPTIPNAVWAKEQSAKSVVEWFNRFST
ncbi:alpha/beta-hydrolase [Coprinopsis marcescibilis]|uniref:Alpha/beta-hydrolase n=1 Tax=Coprinopsis marcescibilis TaxID=230819 RepID=A0A5C3KLN1_COPMA|nr:alpha/beta-hydrolase [Coprinopsis marcescibilis]